MYVMLYGVLGARHDADGQIPDEFQIQPPGASPNDAPLALCGLVGHG